MDAHQQEQNGMDDARRQLKLLKQQIQKIFEKDVWQPQYKPLTPNG